MASEQLNASPRSTSGKGAARSLRRDGHFPAVIYGHSREAQPLTVNSREFSRLLERAGAENTVIELSVDGTTSHTLIREIQRHPVKRNVLHVDFQELVAGERVIVRIPIVLQGIPAGVRLSGGINGGGLGHQRSIHQNELLHARPIMCRACRAFRGKA
jgi:large subunit ribosomal protein L25